MNPASTLSTAQLAIYAVLSLPTIYNLYRHGKRGLLGWLYLLVFCVLRMTGSGIFLSNPASSGAIVILNIGLSPLLLAMLGIMHEGRACRNPNINKKLEIPMVAGLHILVATAIGLIVSGATALSSANPDPSSVTLVKVGISTMLLAWLIIAFLTMASLFLPVQAGSESPVAEDRGWRDGTKLLHAVLIVVPLTGLRVLYSVAADFIQSASLNPITGSLALQVCLSVVPEMLAVVLFIGAGLWTRNIVRK